MMKSFLKIPASLGLCLSVIFASQDAQIEESRLKDSLERAAQPKVSLETSYISHSDIKGSKGGFETAKNKISINNFFAGFSYTNRTFKWSKVDDLPFGNRVDNPIDEMHSLKVDARLPYKISSRWFMLSSLTLASSFEDSTDDSYSVGAFSFASYKLDDKHTIQVGAFANYHPITTVVLPIMSYSYRATHRDGFKFVLGFPRTYIGYHLSRDTLVSFGMIYSQSVVKLSDSSVVERGGFMEIKEYMSNVGISYDYAEDIKLQADIVYGLKRDFDIYNSDGNSKESHQVDSALGANLRVVYTF